jgi:hypothetical protein
VKENEEKMENTAFLAGEKRFSKIPREEKSG